MRILVRMSKVRLNLYIDEHVLAQARDSGLNISAFVERQLAAHAKTAQQQQWLEENRSAIAEYNARVEREGPFNQDLLRF